MIITTRTTEEEALKLQDAVTKNCVRFSSVVYDSLNNNYIIMYDKLFTPCQTS